MIDRTLDNGYNKFHDIMRRKRQHFYWSSIILTLVSGIIGCSKPGATFNVNPVAYVSLMNLAPYASAVDIYFNGILISPNGGIIPGQFSSEYGQLKPGSYTVDFKKTGTDSLLYELPAAQYDTGNFYTLVLYNTIPDSPAVAAARIEDNLSQVNATSSYYRFFDMSPDGVNVSLSLNGSVAQTNRSPADNVANQAFNQFVSVSPGDYTLQVQNSKDSVVASEANYPFAAGYVYTIFLTGTSKGMTVSVLPLLFQ
jgi:hypothetical protein